MTKRKNNPVLAQKAVTKYKRQRTIVLKMLELGKMMNLKLNMFVFDPKTNKLQEIFTDESVKLSAINNMMAQTMTMSNQKNSRDKRKLKFESFDAKLKYKWDDEQELEEAKEEPVEAKETKSVNTKKLLDNTDCQIKPQTVEKLRNLSFENNKKFSKSLEIPAAICCFSTLKVPTNAPYLDEAAHSIQNITFRDNLDDIEPLQVKRQSIDCGLPSTNLFVETLYQKDIGLFKQSLNSECQNKFEWQISETNIKLNTSSKTLQDNFTKRVCPFEEFNMVSKTVDIFDHPLDPSPICYGGYPASLFSNTSSYDDDDF